MLAELFFSDNEQNREIFKKELKQVLSEVPNSIGNKENFWIYFFLGSILTLPNAELQESLNIQKVEVQLSSDQRTLNLRITIGGKVICRSIRTADKDPVIEYGEDHNLSNKDGFIEISKISVALNLGEEVTVGSVNKLFENLAEIYNDYTKQDLKLKKESEALHQAFIYGFMKMNMEASANCFIEFGAGLGTADLVLKVDDTAVIIECKADSKTAEDAINQIKRKGYFRLDILDKPKSIFLVGINFNRQDDEGLKVEEYEIFEPQGLINILMNDDIEELEEEIQKELKFLCYSKNIGKCDPDSLSDNKNAGSFSALLLGQALQYCNKNNDYSCRAERKKMTREEKRLSSSDDDTKDSKITINDGNDINILNLKVVESISQDGTTSPRDDEDVIYNVKITITKDDKESIFKICFPRENSDEIEVKLEKINQLKSRARRASGRERTQTERSTSFIDSGVIEFSSTDDNLSSEESKSSPQKLESSQEKIVEKLIQEIESGEGNYLHEILKDYKDFINSESNLQLFLKGLFMNAEIGGGKIVEEIEVSAGQAGKIDLLLKLPNGKGIIFELKFCDEVKDMVDKQNEAWGQLKSYTDKGNLKYILDPEKSKVIAIVFCKENAECVVETQNFPTPESNFEVSVDSGRGSSRSSSLSGNSFYSSSPSTSLSNTPPPSPGMKRKALSP